MTSKNTQNSNYAHQDWDPVVLKKTTIQTKTPKFQPSEQAIRDKKIENNEIMLQTSTITLRKQIQQARTAKALTQDQLNAQCNFPKGTVQRYENGSAIVNNAHINKMSRILNVKLSAPKPIKIKNDDQLD
jgi:ribosome-binding protein aMBF1 (putative translation factor)